MAGFFVHDDWKLRDYEGRDPWAEITKRRWIGFGTTPLCSCLRSTVASSNGAVRRTRTQLDLPTPSRVVWAG